MINNYKNTFEHLLNFINFIVRYFKYISVFFILSFLSIGSIYFYFNKKEIIYNHEWSIDIDYNIEYLYVDTQEINKLNTNVHNLLNQLVSDNILEVIRKSNVYLSSSRLLQEGGHHDTILYRIIRSDK